MPRDPLRLTAACLLLALAAGCGDGGKGTGPRGGDELAEKQIKEAAESAARSCLVALARERLLRAESEIAKLEGEVAAAEKPVTEMQEELDKGSAAPDLPGRLADARRELARVRARVSPRLEPMKRNNGGWQRLLKQMEASGSRKRHLKIVKHQIDAPNPKNRDERTSTMVLAPMGNKDLLGRENLTFKLTWRKAVRTVGYGKYQKTKVNWELRHVAPIGPVRQGSAPEEN